MSVIFDGNDLGELLIVGAPSITQAVSEPEYKALPAADRSEVLGRRWGMGSVSFECAVLGTPRERRFKLSRLGLWLSVDSPRELLMPDAVEWRYMAMPSGGLDLARHVDGEVFELSFDLTEAAAFGEARSISVPSGGSASFTVHGTYPASPTISAPAAVRNASSGAWGLRLDDGPVLYVATGTSAGARVSIDCAARECKVSGAARLPTLASTWLSLEPGRHVVAMHGTGAAALSFDERWL